MERVKKHLWKKTLPVLLALLLVAGTTGLGTLAVHGGVGPVHNVTQGTYYATIQGAIDVAQVGDVLEVAPGTYSENVVVDVNDLTLQSTGGADSTTITGGNPGIQVEVDDFVLKGFTVDVSEWGVSVLDMEDGTLGINHCIFENATYAVRFGLVTDSKIVIEDNDFNDIQNGGSVFFNGKINNCEVNVMNNTFTDYFRGLVFWNEVIDTQVEVAGNVFTNGTDGVFSGEVGNGVSGTSTISIEDNQFINPSDNGVDIQYLEDGGALTVSNNEFTDAEDCGVDVEYVGYNGPEQLASVTITNNTMTDCNCGVYIYDICYGDVLVEGNTINNPEYGIYIDYSADESTTDVQILDNEIIMDSTSDDCYYGIYVYSAEAVLTISGNTLTGYQGNMAEGIYLEYIGYYGEGPSEVEVSDNIISSCETGINFYDVADDWDAEMMVAGNEIKDCITGFDIENMDSNAADVTILENNIHGNEVGILVEDLYGDDEDPVGLEVMSNVIENNGTGICLESIWLEQSEMALGIFDNQIINNGIGLDMHYVYTASNDLIMVTGNNFSGNESYGVRVYDGALPKSIKAEPAYDAFVLQAQWNWWGDATGPEDNGNGALGDAVSGPVVYDPWIQKMVISPENSTGYKGKIRTFTATLLDNKGGKVDLPLSILMKVTGVNDLEEELLLEGGEATYSYTSEKKGVDQVSASVLFASAPVTGLAPEASAEWVVAETNDDTNDDANDNTNDEDTDNTTNEIKATDTGDAGNMVFYAMMAAMMALAGGAGTLMVRRKND